MSTFQSPSFGYETGRGLSKYSRYNRGGSKGRFLTLPGAQDYTVGGPTQNAEPYGLPSISRGKQFTGATGQTFPQETPHLASPQGTDVGLGVGQSFGSPQGRVAPGTVLSGSEGGTSRNETPQAVLDFLRAQQTRLLEQRQALAGGEGEGTAGDIKLALGSLGKLKKAAEFIKSLDDPNSLTSRIIRQLTGSGETPRDLGVDTELPESTAFSETGGLAEGEVAPGMNLSDFSFDGGGTEAFGDIGAGIEGFGPEGASVFADIDWEGLSSFLDVSGGLEGVGNLGSLSDIGGGLSSSFGDIGASLAGEGVGAAADIGASLAAGGAEAGAEAGTAAATGAGLAAAEAIPYVGAAIAIANFALKLSQGVDFHEALIMSTPVISDTINILGLFGVHVFGGGPSKAWQTFGRRVGEGLQKLQKTEIPDLLKAMETAESPEAITAAVAAFKRSLGSRVGGYDYSGDWSISAIPGATGTKHEAGLRFDPGPIHSGLNKTLAELQAWFANGEQGPRPQFSPIFQPGSQWAEGRGEEPDSYTSKLYDFVQQRNSGRQKEQEILKQLEAPVNQLNAEFFTGKPISTIAFMRAAQTAKQLGVEPNAVEFLAGIEAINNLRPASLNNEDLLSNTFKSAKVSDRLQQILDAKRLAGVNAQREALEGTDTQLGELSGRLERAQAGDPTRTVFMPAQRRVLGPQSPSRLPTMTQLRLLLAQQEREKRLGKLPTAAPAPPEEEGT